jgi:hypothetical protein
MSMDNDVKSKQHASSRHSPRDIPRTPKLSDKILAAAGINSEDFDGFRAHYEQLFLKWDKRCNIRGFTEIGRIFYSALLKCEFTSLPVALLADHPDAFIKLLGDQPQSQSSNLAGWLDIACIFGAQKTTTWIFEQLNYDLKELPIDQKTELLGLIATSSNRDWLNKFWDQIELGTVPEEANRYLKSFSLKRVETMLAHYSPTAESSDVSVVDLSPPREIARIPRETPRASVRISADGSRGYVSNKVWVKSLQYLNVATIAVGATASFACHPSTQYLWLKLFDLLTWPLDNSPETFQGEAYLLNAVLGGVMIGWGTMMLMLSSEVEKSTKIRNTFLASLFSWYITDSVGSGINGVPGNIVLNTTFLIAYLVPLLGICYNERTTNSEEENPDSSIQSGSSHSGFFARKEQDDDSDRSNASSSTSPQPHK